MRVIRRIEIMFLANMTVNVYSNYGKGEKNIKTS